MHINSGSLAVFLISFLAILLVIALNAVRWMIVTRIIQLKISFFYLLKWTIIGNFFNQIFPSALGGDVIRGWLAVRSIGDAGGALSSIALERLVGFVAISMLIVVGQPLLILRLHNTSLSYIALIAVIVGLCASLPLFLLDRLVGARLIGRHFKRVQRFCSDARRLIASPILTLLALLISFVMNGLTLVATTVIANQLGASVSIVDMFLVVPTVLLVACLPISIGGWGVREAGLAIGFSMIGQPPSVAVATSVLVGLANFFSGVPGAIAWILLPSEDRHSQRISTNSEAPHRVP